MRFSFSTFLFLFVLQLTFAQQGIFWLNTPTGIERMDANGENRQTLIAWEISVAPQGVTMDKENEKLYWTDWVNKKIQRSNLDGSFIEDLQVPDLGLPEGIALDVENEKMYWVDSGTKKIQRANMDGTEVEDLVTYPSVNLDGIGVDAPNQKVYWALWGAGSAVGKIMRANTDGTDVEELVAIPNGILQGLDLDLENGKIYWTDLSFNRIQRSDLNGNNMENLVENLSSPNGISLDMNNQKMYWTESGAKKIQRANLDGTNVELVSDVDIDAPQDLVVNFDFVSSVFSENQQPKIEIFPNPSSELITIKNLQNDDALQIFDAKGTAVWSKESIQNQELKIDVSKFLIGSYFLEIWNKKGQKITQSLEIIR